MIFDQCCGVGRVAIPLATRGMRVIGVDQSEPYIELARAAAARQHADARFFVGDAFAWTPPEPCDAGFNWFTSFGYHADDTMNIQMLEAAHRSIRPGGRFVLEYLATPGMLRRFRSSSVHRPRGAAADGLLILDEPTIDFRAGVVVSTWTFLHRDGRREERRVQTRLFMPHELIRLFEQAGFRVVELLDGDTGEALELGSRRMAVIGER